MNMHDCRSLIVWQKSHQSTLMIYKLTGPFPKAETWGLVSQTQRASTSVAIDSKGCGKIIQNKASIFHTSYASAQETEYIKLISKDFGILNKGIHKTLLEKVIEVKSMTSILIKNMKKIAHEA
ncbi:MAG TPA: four helix bundle protein [Cytophagales bacterium]|nr:four helix bundle protein [Cytophagales bacterium]